VKTKVRTLAQAETARRRAIVGLHNLGKDEDADRIEGMSTQEYAAERGIEIIRNPQRRSERRIPVATSTPSKADLQDQISRAIDALNDAYSPEASRGDLAQAVGDALDILNEGDDSDDDDDDNDGNGDDDED
jgi:hypothetical protein